MQVRAKKIVGIIVLAVIILLAVLFFLYRSSQTSGEALDNWFCSSSFGNWNYSDDGMFFYGSDGISYFDASSGKSVFICTKAGCQHEEESCPAKVEAIYCSGIVYDGNKLYYVSSSGDQDYKSLNLTECDINGENRKKLADFPDIQSPTAVAYYQEYVVVAYENGFDLEKSENLWNREAGIYVYNRTTEKGEVIYSEKAGENSILSLTVIEGEIYFCRNYSTLSDEEVMQQDASDQLRSCLYCISLDGGEAEEICDGLSTLTAGVSSVDGQIVFSTDSGLQVYDRDTKKVSLIKEQENISLITSRLSDDVAVMQQAIQEDQAEYDVYLYDEDGTLEKVGRTEYLLLAVYDSTSYAMDNDGNIVILDTEEWRNGNFETKYSISF